MKLLPMRESRKPVTDHAIRLYRTMALITALRTLIEIDVFAHLDQGSTVSSLAKATVTAPSILRRLLRVVVENGLVRFQSVDHTYWNTRVSSAYEKGSESSKFVKMMFDFSLGIDIAGWIAERGAEEPEQYTPETHNAFTFTFDREGSSIWQVLGDNPRKLESLHNGLETMDRLHPFASSQYQTCLRSAISCKDENTLIVDVGGGNGRFLADLLRANSGVDPTRVILQEIPLSLDYAQRNRDLPDGVVLMEHDFFTPQPVQSAHIYHMRACLHDYGDLGCVQILGHLKDAMSRESTLLVAENVISATPLPGDNMGAMDLLMLGVGGKERTLHDFSNIFRKSGLQLDAVWPSGTSNWTVLQASKLAGSL